jgi:DNA-binding transcriptional MerR regulator
MRSADASRSGLNISAVERDTGLSKDTLRMWERRYGFPEPERDGNGERIYPASQVERLRVIKRLMDRGHRPGKIIASTLEELIALGRRAGESGAPRQDLDVFLQLLKTHQLAELRRHLSQVLARQGLQRFVLDTVAPLNKIVGDTWMRGEFAVFEEHAYTEQMQSLLRNAVGAIQPEGRAPKVLLTTLPNESHGLGLLMVEALLALEGACCVPLGTETPCAEVVRAAAAHRVEIVALSFSAAFSDKQAVAGLKELRALLPVDIPIWAGGATIGRVRKPVPGVELMPSLEETIDKLREWRTLRA